MHYRHRLDDGQQALVAIWNGSRLRDLRRKHLAGRRGEITACATCQYIQGLPAIADLDDDLERSLGVYS